MFSLTSSSNLPNLYKKFQLISRPNPDIQIDLPLITKVSAVGAPGILPEKKCGEGDDQVKGVACVDDKSNVDVDGDDDGK